MPQITEAACLLQSGSMYHRRLGLKGGSGEEIFAGVKPGAVSIYFGDEPIYHFDLDGRWQRAFLEGTHYLKGIDATVRSIDREREESGMVLRRETLPYAVAADLDASIRSVALGLIDALDSARLEILLTPATARAFAPEDFRSFLERVASWDSAAWFAHRERYLSSYGPLPFLPPDCPNSLVLQASLGHIDRRVFGGGRPAKHYVRSSSEFREHVRTVVTLTGRRMAQHRGVFLGGADVLREPVGDILDFLRTIAEFLPIGENRARTGESWDDFPGKLGSVHAFLDDFSPPLPDLHGWQMLRAAGLGQVTLGVESGDPGIRSCYGKSWQDTDLRQAFANLKVAGIRVGMVVLIGACGLRVLSDRHIETTATLIESLPIDRRDLVSLVDSRSIEESSGSTALSDEESAAQVAMLKGRLARVSKIVAYNPLKRWA
jgi:hypothetical protein